MSVIVGSARSSYGHPEMGDQNGKEVSTQEFYLPSQGYWLGFMPNDAKVAAKMVKCMTNVCNNNHVGYSQPYRMSLREAYVKYKTFKGIKENCCCDCSSLINTILYACGYNLPNFNTASMPTVLRKSGLFTETKITKATQCKNGMILVTPTKGHTMLVVDNGKGKK